MPRLASVVIATAGLLAGGCAARESAPVLREPDVVFAPTPSDVVAAMLQMADVGPGDVVYDLGCGDGRIPIAAARDHGARAVCVEIDPELVRRARERVRRAGLQDRVEVRHADLFETDLSGATVVTLYLLDDLNLRLRPKLRRELPHGARVVSHTFSMGDWEPDEWARVGGTVVYLWRIAK